VGSRGWCALLGPPRVHARHRSGGIAAVRRARGGRRRGEDDRPTRRVRERARSRATPRLPHPVGARASAKASARFGAAAIGPGEARRARGGAATGAGVAARPP
jgi:hypothetical protein